MILLFGGLVFGASAAELTNWIRTPDAPSVTIENGRINIPGQLLKDVTE